MRPSLRSGTFLRLLALGLVTALPCAAPVRAQVGPCFARAGRPFLFGFSFHVATTKDVDAWAERFGFGPLEPPTGNGLVRTLRLRQGLVWWTSQPPVSFEDLDTRIGTPVSYRRYAYPSDAPEPPDEPMVYDVPCPPNGALRPMRAIALMDDNPRLVDAFTFRRAPDHQGPIQYAGNFKAPQVGALVHDARYESGNYRFIFPTDSTGLAARWLASAPPRWIGVAFEVADVAATERALAERGVATVRVHEQGGEAVWVLPEVTGGPLLEFVQTRDR